MTNRNLYFARLCALALPLALAACAPQQAKPGKHDEGAVVEQRAQERWNLLIAHKAEKAYDYLSPGFRQTISREKYAQQKNDVALQWKAVHVVGHSCDGDTCDLNINVDVTAVMPGIGKPAPATVPTLEHWIRLNGNWFYLPDTRLKPVPVKPADAEGGASPAPGKP